MPVLVSHVVLTVNKSFFSEAKFINFNSLTDGISDSSDNPTPVESDESQSDGDTEDVDDAAKEISELENANDDLLNEAVAIKKKFNTEYAQMKKHAENELMRSKKLLKSMKKLQEKAKTKKESDEVKAMMQILGNNIELFQRQIKYGSTSLFKYRSSFWYKRLLGFQSLFRISYYLKPCLHIELFFVCTHLLSEHFIKT